MSELRSYEVNSVLRRIAGELYLAGSKGTSSSPHSLLSQLVMNLNVSFINQLEFFSSAQIPSLIFYRDGQ